MNDSFGYACGILVHKHRRAIECISLSERTRLREIRLRRGKKLSVTFDSGELFVLPSGRLSEEPFRALDVTDEDITSAYMSALNNSIYSYEREITEGYVTTKGGGRVGFCGRAVYNSDAPDRLFTLKDISSLNIRIAREVINCGEEIYNKIFSSGLCSLLVAGAPSSGKTTVLRDLCRLLSRKYRVSLIDERGEIAAVSDGIAYNDVGYRTDVLTGYSRAEAVSIAVRVLSPQVIICDELGSESDIVPALKALNSGTALIASCHASSREELAEHPVISQLIRRGSFNKAVFLGTGRQCGKMTGCYDLSEGICSDLQAALC